MVQARQSILKFEIFIIFVYSFWTFLPRGVDMRGKNSDFAATFSPGWYLQPGLKVLFKPELKVCNRPIYLNWTNAPISPGL